MFKAFTDQYVKKLCETPKQIARMVLNAFAKHPLLIVGHPIREVVCFQIMERVKLEQKRHVNTGFKGKVVISLVQNMIEFKEKHGLHLPPGYVPREVLSEQEVAHLAILLYNDKVFQGRTAEEEQAPHRQIIILDDPDRGSAFLQKTCQAPPGGPTESGGKRTHNCFHVFVPACDHMPLPATWLGYISECRRHA